MMYPLSVVSNVKKKKKKKSTQKVIKVSSLPPHPSPPYLFAQSA